jgi:hypothetical protein
MRFLAQDETVLLATKLRRQMANQPRPKLVLYYRSGNRDYSDAANIITASIGDFAEANLHFLFCVGGDGWNEGTAANERWSRYRRWREANGESRRLYDAPGHRFERGDTQQLSKAIEFSLRLGWDALVAAEPGRQLLLLTHDDRIEIYRGLEWRSLAGELIRLGYWYRQGGTEMQDRKRP